MNRYLVLFLLTLVYPSHANQLTWERKDILATDCLLAPTWRHHDPVPATIKDKAGIEQWKKAEKEKDVALKKRIDIARKKYFKAYDDSNYMHYAGKIVRVNTSAPMDIKEQATFNMIDRAYQSVKNRKLFDGAKIAICHRGDNFAIYFKGKPMPRGYRGSSYEFRVTFDGNTGKIINVISG